MRKERSLKHIFQLQGTTISSYVDHNKENCCGHYLRYLLLALAAQYTFHYNILW